MDIIKKTSLLSDSRFPTFVRGNSDFDLLRKFIKSYFESVEESKQASHEITYARENSDIDSTTEEFLERFYSTLCPDLPKNIKANKRLLLKHSRELYQKKGTPESFHLLFRILFNDTISLRYPSEYILRASDGIWNQPTSIRVTFVNIPEDKILGLIYEDIYCKNKTGIVRNVVLDVKKVKNSDVYEIYIDNKKGTGFNIGDTVTIDGITGTVAPTLTDVKILSRGKKFKLGETILLDVGPTKDTVVKVTKIDSGGSILKTKIINYGVNYTNDLYVSVAPAAIAKVTEQKPQEVVGYPIEEESDGFYEYVTIVQMGKIGPLYDYFAEDYTVIDEYYTSSVVSSFGGVTSGGTNSTSEDFAIFSMVVGSVIRYPGYWSSNRGFLNDPIIRLQDNGFYQNFSYLIRSAIPRESYDPYVKTIVHPAGFRMFSESYIEDVFDLSPMISYESGANYSVSIQDSYTISDANFIDVSLGKTDTTSPTEIIIPSLSKSLNDALNVVDNFANAVTMQKFDTTILGEVIENNITMEESDAANISENYDILNSKPIDEQANVIEYISSNMVSGKSDISVASETVTKNVSTPFADVITVTEIESTNISADKFDAVSVSDTSNINNTVDKLDEISISETVKKDGSKLTSDIVDLIEVKATNISADKFDAVSVSEIHEISKGVEISDEISISETVKKDGAITLVDTIDIVETKDTTILVSKSDDINVSDILSINSSIENFDAVSSTETVNKDGAVTLVDTINIVETKDTTISIVNNDTVDIGSYSDGAYVVANWTDAKYVVGDDVIDFVIQTN